LIGTTPEQKGPENMATNIARYETEGTAYWGVVSASGISPLDGVYPTTAALIEQGEADWRAASGKAASVPMVSVKILSPVTAPCRVYCQGANYRQHMIESGMDPDAKPFNMFFTKSDASISPARGSVQRPKHVMLLDYEIELALVFRRPISSSVAITQDTLKDYVFAVTIANDLSARDVQLPQMQFFKGKSYRAFCPIGPWLTVLEPDEFAYLDELELQLSVNGSPRQRDTTKNLVFKPAETISELSTFANVRPGDVLLTGTPSGCALRVPPAPIRRILQLLPERQFWNLFIKAQRRRPQNTSSLETSSTLTYAARMAALILESR
jgi:2-keto-4-pentenoate hydratase/2-oxohepta-3-ene-1,7-dioic acid hydratase in catechol pathway